MLDCCRIYILIIKKIKCARNNNNKIIKIVDLLIIMKILISKIRSRVFERLFIYKEYNFLQGFHCEFATIHETHYSAPNRLKKSYAA